MHGSSEDARVEVTSRAGDGELVVTNATLVEKDRSESFVRSV